MPLIDRVISGGQTGVDRAALDAARDQGLDCGGWCPKGRRSEDGPIPTRYPLKETESGDYRIRTRRNVADSDGTLILVTGGLTGGTALTRETALAEDKPLLVVDLDAPVALEKVCDWIRGNGVRTLNVAGPRESQRPGVGHRAHEFLFALFSELKSGGPKTARFASGKLNQKSGHE